MPLSVVRNGKTTTISVQGSFDADAVSRLRNVLRELHATDGRDPNIVVDLRRARDVPPIALAALVEGARQMGGIRYLGLSNQSARLLNHLTAASPE